MFHQRDVVIAIKFNIKLITIDIKTEYLFNKSPKKYISNDNFVFFYRTTPTPSHLKRIRHRPSRISCLAPQPNHHGSCHHTTPTTPPLQPCNPTHTATPRAAAPGLLDCHHLSLQLVWSVEAKKDGVRWGCRVWWWQ